MTGWVPPNKYPVAIKGGRISPSDNFTNMNSHTNWIPEGIVHLETVDITSDTAEVTFTSGFYGLSDWTRYEMLRWVWFPVMNNSFGTGIDYTYIRAQTAAYPTYSVNTTTYAQLMSGNNPNSGSQTTVNSLSTDGIICGMMGRDTSMPGNFMIADMVTATRQGKQVSMIGYAGGYHAGSYFTGGYNIYGPQPTMKVTFSAMLQTGTATTFADKTTVSMYGFYSNDGGDGDWE